MLRNFILNLFAKNILLEIKCLTKRWPKLLKLVLTVYTIDIQASIFLHNNKLGFHVIEPMSDLTLTYITDVDTASNKY